VIPRRSWYLPLFLLQVGNFPLISPENMAQPFPYLFEIILPESLCGSGNFFIVFEQTYFGIFLFTFCFFYGIL